MIQPNRPVARLQNVGDYRRFKAAAASPVAPPAGTSLPAATVPMTPQPATGAGAAPAKKGFWAWLMMLLGGSPTPRPQPPVFDPGQPPAPRPQPPVFDPGQPPAPRPQPPVFDPGQPPVSGGPIQVFFTNTYQTSQQMGTSAASAANKQTAQNDPNNPDQQVVKLIDSAKPGSVLEGAFYDIGVQDVVDAFVRAKQRGVDVRLVTEQDNTIIKSTGQKKAVISQLEAAGIPMQARPSNGGLMHDKFLVANGQTVWTGSYNITDGGTYSDNNNALEIQSPELAQQYDAEFNKMFTSGNFKTDAAGAVHPAPTTVKVGNYDVTTYFSPVAASESGAKQAILDEIGKSQKSVQFLAFSFTDKEIAQAMVAKSQQGVKVEGVFDREQSSSRYSADKTLASAGLDVRLDNNPGLLHHKVIIVDDNTLITGSFNFSNNAQHNNDENMVVIHNCPDLVAQYRQEFQRIQGTASPVGASTSSQSSTRSPAPAF